MFREETNYLVSTSSPVWKFWRVGQHGFKIWILVLQVPYLLCGEVGTQSSVLCSYVAVFCLFVCLLPCFLLVKGFGALTTHA